MDNQQTSKKKEASTRFHWDCQYMYYICMYIHTYMQIYIYIHIHHTQIFFAWPFRLPSPPKSRTIPTAFVPPHWPCPPSCGWTSKMMRKEKPAEVGQRSGATADGIASFPGLPTYHRVCTGCTVSNRKGEQSWLYCIYPISQILEAVQR